METVRTRADLLAVVSGWKQAGERVALVPTMGALHAGHRALVRRGRRAGRVVASLFLNPLQFDDPGDLQGYPQDQARDAALLREEGADLLYMPPHAEIYPDGFATTIRVAGLSGGLCGRDRPGHFTGVATVVCKLLLQCRADVAVFGEKDFQQLQIVRRMARDLDLPAEIIGQPTVREPDGLACSSRNLRLSARARAVAPALAATLFRTVARLRQGEAPGQCLAGARDAVLAAGFSGIDYLELRAGPDLAPVESLPAVGVRLFAAARLEQTRLIDNVPLDPPEQAGEENGG